MLKQVQHEIFFYVLIFKTKKEVFIKKKKDVGVIIKFDYKEYSKEETIFLYQRFFEIFAEAKGGKCPKILGKYSIIAFQTVTKNVKRFELLKARYINSFDNFVKSLIKN